MRFNRGTIALLLIGIIVIIGAVVLNNNQAAAPGEPTATPAAPTGPLFEALTDANRIVSVEIQNDLTAARTVLTRGGDNVWAVEATNGHNYPVDQDGSNGAVTSLIGLQYSDSFDTASLADFGLSQPNYTITVKTDDEGVYVMHVGDKNPGGNRYYVVTEVTPGTGAPATEESAMSTAEAAEMSTEAAEAAETEAAEEESEAAEAATVEATATPEAEATEEKTAEANSRIPAAPDRLAATPEVTAEAAETEAVEATAEATEAATEEATVEATPAAEAVTPEVTEAAAEAAEATVAPTPTIEPLVNLSGNQSVRLVAKDVLDKFIAFVDTPPYIVPTDTPTPLPTANPYSEVEMTATAAVQQTATMDMLLSTLQARQTATAGAITPTPQS